MSERWFRLLVVLLLAGILYCEISRLRKTQPVYVENPSIEVEMPFQTIDVNVVSMP